jgi:hypothetical protein
VTICDVIGTATDHWDFAARLTTATVAVNTLQTAGSLTTLNNAYIAIASAANDAAVLTQIGNANAAIAALSADPQVPVLNTAWNYIANYLNREKGFQNQASLNYFELIPDEKVSVYALSQSLGQFGTQCQACGPNQFLQDVVDQTTLTGQAVVGALREGQNQTQLAAAGLQLDITPNIAPEITPPNAVTPVT